MNEMQPIFHREDCVIVSISRSKTVTARNVDVFLLWCTRQFSQILSCFTVPDHIYKSYILDCNCKCIAFQNVHDYLRV